MGTCLILMAFRFCFVYECPFKPRLSANSSLQPASLALCMLVIHWTYSFFGFEARVGPFYLRKQGRETRISREELLREGDQGKRPRLGLGMTRYKPAQAPGIRAGKSGEPSRLWHPHRKGHSVVRY